MKKLSVLLGVVVVAVIGWFIVKPGTPTIQIAEVVQNTGSVDTGAVNTEETSVLDELNLNDTATMYTLNTQDEKSVVMWKAEKTGGQHNGIVKITEGTAYANEGKLLEGKVTMDMASLDPKDIDSEDLENHLKGPEFFDVEQYPTASFEITSITNNEVNGQLTLKGVTKEITFPLAEVTVTDESIAVKAEFAIDRTEWNVNGGIPLVSNFMELSFDLVFTKSQ